MGKPLLDVLRELSLDPDKQAAFDDNPARYLAQFGYEDVEADHLSEAFSLVADTLPPDAAQAVAATATALPDVDDGSGGAPDTTINPDEDAFGGVDESFDTAALNGDAGLGADLEDVADVADPPDVDDADPADGGFGTGELALDDLAGDGGPADDLGDGDTAFGIGSDGATGPAAEGLVDDLVGDDGGQFLDDDAPGFDLTGVAGLDDAGDADLGDSGLDDGLSDGPDDGDGLDLGPAHDGAPLDDGDDGPADDPGFDDVGSF